MTQATHLIHVDTRGKRLYNISGRIERWVSEQALRTGLLTVFVQHTSGDHPVAPPGTAVEEDFRRIFAMGHPSGPRFWVIGS